MSENDIEVDPATFERLNSVVCKEISEELLDKAKFSIKILEGMVGGLAVKISAELLADKRIDKDISVPFDYPATAWDYTKQQINNKWPRCNLKVRYQRAIKTVNVKQYLTYPEAKIKLPPEWGRGYIYETHYVANEKPWGRRKA